MNPSLVRTIRTSCPECEVAVPSHTVNCCRGLLEIATEELLAAAYAYGCYRIHGVPASSDTLEAATATYAKARDAVPGF